MGSNGSDGLQTHAVSSKPFEQAQEQPVQVEQFALRFKTEEIAEGSRAEDAFQVSQKGAEEFGAAFLAAKRFQSDLGHGPTVMGVWHFLAAAATTAGASELLATHAPECGWMNWQGSAYSKCLGLSGKCCPTENGKFLDCCSGSEAKGLSSPEALAAQLQRCSLGAAHGRYAPPAEPDLPGATDTTELQCQYNSPFGQNSMCCGWRPHFNWVVGTCESNAHIPNATFCDGIPPCARAPQINYAAAYQYNGSHFVLQDASTAGDLSDAGVAGSFKDKTGWEKVKSKFRWEGGEGDWPTKYAPWGLGAQGPRGLTPPAGLWVLSVDSFYYGTLYMLSQLTLNAQGHREHNNCWEWEFDAIEGLLGTVPKGSPLPGNLNQLYVTATAQVTGCMPMPGTAAQGNGKRQTFSEPESFRGFCRANPSAVGCRPWTSQDANIWHGGGHPGTDRFENFEHTPYVFAVVLDHQGFWVYRWRPDSEGHTGWPGLDRFRASRVLPQRPRPVKDAQGLKTDVRGATEEAVILIPSLPPEAACTRSSPERVDFRWGAGALGSMGFQRKDYKLGQEQQGAQNWWAHFVDTHQLQDYPLSIAGVPASEASKASYSCSQKDEFGSECDCEYGKARRTSFLSQVEGAPGPNFEVAMMLQNLLR
ncbi:unnamed protein product [Durusdinium trenchii]|uniref:Uncharacterized protein n=1 Tax=Durusdinium trenchii TaxID=1381693 RepID=A0ABP0NRV6_9DINO